MLKPAEVSAQKKKKGPAAKPRPWGRLLVGIFPGYIAASFITSAFTALLPIHRSEASLLGLLLVGLVFVALFVYAFAAPSWKRALRDISLFGLISAALLFLIKGVFDG
ncbi:MAG: hypothetical protein AAF950_07430 [Pseudomonadota bacterium]